MEQFLKKGNKFGFKGHENGCSGPSTALVHYTWFSWHSLLLLVLSGLNRGYQSS